MSLTPLQTAWKSGGLGRGISAQRRPRIFPVLGCTPQAAVLAEQAHHHGHGRSPGLGSGVLGWSPASTTHSGCVILAKLPSISEPCFLSVESQAAEGWGRFREVEGTRLATGTVY